MDEETGLYYYGARYYDPRSSVWISVDPIAEKYPSISPYAYVLNNPLKYIDPDGRDIVLSGGLSQKALQEMQGAVGSSITLTLNDNGSVCYTKNIEGVLSFNARKIANIIDNSSIIIDLLTMHEITEAYKGAQNSQVTGISASPATNVDASNPNRAYRQAHDNASFQYPVNQTLYDANGKVTTDINKAVKGDWSVRNVSDKEKVIQTYP